MDLISRFKRDYFNYLLSIIIPMLITAGSIPLFKQILGASGYGNFAITFNSVLLGTAMLSGWISQSILRYYPTSEHKVSFAKQSLQISIYTQLAFFVPGAVFAWYLHRDIILCLLFSIAMFATSLQFTVLAISQSVFLSKKSIFSELIRTTSYLGFSLILLQVKGLHYMYALFIAIISSYFLSFFYLQHQTKKILSQVEELGNVESVPRLFRKFLHYGGPLSLWFIFAYLISLIDKFYLRANSGAEIQGNYQAIFDLLSKSITVFISPVVISLLPLLTNAYQNGHTSEIKKLLRTIIGIEFLGMIIAGILYWWFGATILFKIVHVPETLIYKQMGLLILVGTFVWQMAIVVHKRHELKYRSMLLLWLSVVAFLVQLCIYAIWGRQQNLIVFPIGYAAASFTYLILVSISSIRDFAKTKMVSQTH